LTESFYVQVDEDVYESAQNTAGPWEATSQHGGPPAALVGRAIERLGQRNDVQVARVTFEILRSIPVARLRVAASVLRPGRNVELVEASLFHEEDELVRAMAWRFRRSDLPLPHSDGPAPKPGPHDCEPVEPYETDWKSYMQAMEWRFATGGFPTLGPAEAWMRMRIPLLPDEEPSPLTRVLVAADSGSGISAVLDWNDWLFINTDLTVSLHRPLVGEWLRMDASTTIQPHGVGLASTALFDVEGPIGRGAQSLYIAPRR
jgi:acyl-CoA thioesterase